MNNDFNPRAPCGARLAYTLHFSSKSYFNPRAPCGARLALPAGFPFFVTFQSTRPVRGATRPGSPAHADLEISIHAPRAGRDAAVQPGGRGPCDFNPRAPCGARRYRRFLYNEIPKFQSTRPVRGATSRIFTASGTFRFQSTRPVRGATPHRRAGGQNRLISIHAPRAGRDFLISFQVSGMVENFNPRAPCGARLPQTMLGMSPGIFQSTRPVRGATGHPQKRLQPQDISIHAPRAGRDLDAIEGRMLTKPFQSTRPVRGATHGGWLHGSAGRRFQSTRPVRGATCW